MVVFSFAEVIWFRRHLNRTKSYTTKKTLVRIILPQKRSVRRYVVEICKSQKNQKLRCQTSRKERAQQRGSRPVYIPPRWNKPPVLPPSHNPRAVRCREVASLSLALSRSRSDRASCRLSTRTTHERACFQPPTCGEEAATVVALERGFGCSCPTAHVPAAPKRPTVKHRGRSSGGYCFSRFRAARQQAPSLGSDGQKRPDPRQWLSV